MNVEAIDAGFSIVLVADDPAETEERIEYAELGVTEVKGVKDCGLRERNSEDGFAGDDVAEAPNGLLDALPAILEAV